MGVVGLDNEERSGIAPLMPLQEYMHPWGGGIYKLRTEWGRAVCSNRQAIKPISVLSDPSSFLRYANGFCPALNAKFSIQARQLVFHRPHR